jgi:hypothetical protein
MRSAISSKKRWQSEKSEYLRDDFWVWRKTPKCGVTGGSSGVAALASSYAGKRIIFWRAAKLAPLCYTEAHLEAYTSSNVSQKDTISRSYRPPMTLARETSKDEKTATGDQLSAMPEAPGTL